MFMNIWPSFVQALVLILRASINANINRPWGDAFTNMLEAVIDDLTSNITAAQVREATVNDDADDHRIIEHLAREMNTVVEFVRYADLQIPQQRETAILAANEALGSIEKLLNRLPRPLRSLIEIIREMLGFAKLLSGN
jgi:hypothetical protein